jgi:hypothetical protein
MRRAYKPPTERGAALALGQGIVLVPVKLLTEMSESTADNNRLSFAVEWVPSRNSQRWERVLRIPGCLTSEDEERETWTAESLRVSNT